ncbi:MAG: TetR/AcrR family transcriptional regulator [Solirubrobacteraceae bacterium]
MTQRLTRAEKQAQTRAALIDAAQTVFLRDGFDGASVERITAEAGYTRGAFYSNFDTKEQLFVELLQDRIYSYYRRMGERRLADIEHQPTIRETGEELAKLQEDPEAGRIFPLFFEVLAVASRSEELRSLPASFWSGNRDLMAELLRKAFAASGKQPPADPKLIATAAIALDVGLSIQR